MRYSINFDKTVNQLVPHYLGGRKLILYLQALVSPLQVLNQKFLEWARETKIEASMTSQVFKFEWFLNHKFSQYFVDPTARISLQTQSRLGAELHWEKTQAVDVNNAITRLESENVDPNDTMILYNSTENEAVGNVSFMVYSPEIDTTKISQTEYIAQLRYQINKYKTSGKTFSIQYNNETI